MHLPPLSYVSAAWGVGELCIAVKTHSKSGGISKDRGSLYLIWIVCAVSVWLGIRVGSRAHAWDLPAHYPLFLIGYAVFVMGVLFRWFSIFYLGRFFTPNVVILKEHHLVDTGPYRFIRHPTYTGALCAAFGVTLTMANLAALLIILLPVLTVVLWRIRLEENALAEAFGEPYRRYRQRTKRLLPLIY